MNFLPHTFLLLFFFFCSSFYSLFTQFLLAFAYVLPTFLPTFNPTLELINTFFWMVQSFCGLMIFCMFLYSFAIVMRGGFSVKKGVFRGGLLFRGWSYRDWRRIYSMHLGNSDTMLLDFRLFGFSLTLSSFLTFLLTFYLLFLVLLTGCLLWKER